jgi:hypothetical protein
MFQQTFRHIDKITLWHTLNVLLLTAWNPNAFCRQPQMHNSCKQRREIKEI